MPSVTRRVNFKYPPINQSTERSEGDWFIGGGVISLKVSLEATPSP